MSTKTPVIFNHDAAIDEYMAAVLLTTMDSVDLLGIVVTNADCIADPAMTASWQIQSFIGRTDIPLSLSRARGWNPFPWSYRGDCIKETRIAPLQNHGPHPDWPPYPDGDRWLAETLDNAQTPITLLINCPLTTLRGVLDCPQGKARMANIQQLIWMGGAIHVAGNLDPTTIPPLLANPYAEWNAFWDPYAIDWIFKNTTFPITVFPLDVTNQAAITPDFMTQLQAQGKDFRYSDLANQSYKLVDEESFYDMWDVLTTTYLARPDLFAPPTPMNLTIETEGDNQGSLRQQVGGREAAVVLEVANLDGFYEYVLGQFRRS